MHLPVNQMNKRHLILTQDVHLTTTFCELIRCRNPRTVLCYTDFNVTGFGDALSRSSYAWFTEHLQYDRCSY